MPQPRRTAEDKAVARLERHRHDFVATPKSTEQETGGVAE